MSRANLETILEKLDKNDATPGVAFKTRQIIAQFVETINDMDDVDPESLRRLLRKDTNICLDDFQNNDYLFMDIPKSKLMVKFTKGISEYNDYISIFSDQKEYAYEENYQIIEHSMLRNLMFDIYLDDEKIIHYICEQFIVFMKNVYKLDINKSMIYVMKNSYEKNHHVLIKNDIKYNFDQTIPVIDRFCSYIYNEQINLIEKINLTGKIKYVESHYKNSYFYIKHFVNGQFLMVDDYYLRKCYYPNSLYLLDAVISHKTEIQNGELKLSGMIAPVVKKLTDKEIEDITISYFKNNPPIERISSSSYHENYKTYMIKNYPNAKKIYNYASMAKILNTLGYTKIRTNAGAYWTK